MGGGERVGGTGVEDQGRQGVMEGEGGGEDPQGEDAR